MKRLLRIFLFTLIITLSLVYTAYADNSYDGAGEVYGLLSVSKVINFEDESALDAEVGAQSYADIMNFYFGEGFWADKIPMNSDAVSDLAEYSPKISQSKYKLSSYKDFGFIKKEDRSAYSAMCSAGYLDNSVDMLRPNAPLTYRYLFSLLKSFSSFAEINNNYDISQGKITDVYADKNDIVIRQDTGDGIKEYSFNKMHSFYVYSEGKLAPYSYNIKRGQSARIYTADGAVIYVSIDESRDKLKGYDELGDGYIYVCNEYDNELIFKNKLTGAYMKMPFDEDIMIYEGRKKHPVSEINNTLLDRNCYYIIDTLSGRIKYINITG